MVTMRLVMIKRYLRKAEKLKIENCKMKISNCLYSMYVSLSVESRGAEFAICIFQSSFCNALELSFFLPLSDHSTRSLPLPVMTPFCRNKSSHRRPLPLNRLRPGQGSFSLISGERLVDLDVNLLWSRFLVFRQRYDKYAVPEFSVDLRSV